ncbi:phiSA1p31-related protein [Kitasatospora fiedleri]|uniref:phiSA1p31-related protein n=1 Tax=Kitasatospora fiedleri TaxID=2991545 RepID=UPI00249CB5A4|nr:phiSA1p31-related protein [Kitasatospora fiedleri]
MTEQTFKAGDKVTHAVFGDGEVKFGPFRGMFSADDGTGDHYTVAFTAGSMARRAGSVRGGSLTLRPEFEIGACVLFNEERSKVVAGPFTDKYAPSHPWYVLEDEDGNHETSAARFLTLAPADEPTELKIGGRARVLVDGPHLAGLHVGDVVEVTGVEAGSDNEPDSVDVYHNGTTWYVDASQLEALPDEPSGYCVISGVRYDLSAEYRDKDDDMWQFSPEQQADDGTPAGKMRGWSTFDSGCSLRYVLDTYGPLTRVTT